MAIYENDEQVSMILIMGVTGSGKSYFINKLADGAVVEGHSLKSSKFSKHLIRLSTDSR
jgi:predicted GTPase